MAEIEPAVHLQPGDADGAKPVDDTTVVTSTTPGEGEAVNNTAGEGGGCDVGAFEEGNTKRKASGAGVSRSKWRKVAIYVAYVGHGYHGMQRQARCKTIEGELLKALYKVGAIDSEEFLKLQWMRAARTDKGVSAVGQVVSLYAHLEQDDPALMVDKLNKELPAEIRVLAACRTTPMFCSRKMCDKRRYEYILPAWCFDPQYGHGRYHYFPRPKAADEEGETAEEPPAAGAAAEGPAPVANGKPGDGVGVEAGAAPAAACPDTAAATAEAGQAAGGTDPAGAEGAAISAQQDSVPATEGAAKEASAAVVEEGADGSAQAASASAGAAVAAADTGSGEADAGVVAAVGAESDGGRVEAAAEEGVSARDAVTPAKGEGAAGIGDPSNGAEGEATPAEGGSGATPGADTEADDKDPFEESSFVFDEACQERLSALLAEYEGTRNFHNFTVGTPASWPQAKRYIIACYCAGVVTIQGRSWVRLVVVGQSFMLHQIRKMVGLAVSVMRGVAPESCLRDAMSFHKELNVPLAPELGLFLDEVFYDAYNSRWGDIHGALSLEPYMEAVDLFKQQQLYPYIAERDRLEKINKGWLRTINDRNFQFSEWSSISTNKVGVKPKPQYVPRSQQPEEQEYRQQKRQKAEYRGGRQERGHYGQDRSHPQKQAQAQDQVQQNGSGDADDGGAQESKRSYLQDVQGSGAAVILGGMETYGDKQWGRFRGEKRGRNEMGGGRCWGKRARGAPARGGGSGGGAWQGGRGNVTYTSASVDAEWSD